MPAIQYPKVYLYRRIVSAKLFIDDHFDEKIDLGNIADEACFSKFHFIRLFAAIYNKTPHQYLSSIRIEKAKQLLLTGIDVAHICYAVGFESVSSFTGLFKRLQGKRRRFTSFSSFKKSWLSPTRRLNLFLTVLQNKTDGNELVKGEL